MQVFNKSGVLSVGHFPIGLFPWLALGGLAQSACSTLCFWSLPAWPDTNYFWAALPPSLLAEYSIVLSGRFVSATRPGLQTYEQPTLKLSSRSRDFGLARARLDHLKWRGQSRLTSESHRYSLTRLRRSLHALRLFHQPPTALTSAGTRNCETWEFPLGWPPISKPSFSR